MTRRQFEMQLAIKFNNKKTEKDGVSAYRGLTLKDKVYNPKEFDFGGW